MDDDDWQFPAPREDPEARKATPGGEGGGCPRIIPDVNFVEGDIEDENEAPPGTPPSP